MIDDEEGMNNALEYYTDNESYWGDWTDEDPYTNVDEVTNVDSAEEMEEEDDDELSDDDWGDDYWDI